MATKVFNFKLEDGLRESFRKKAESDGRTISGAIKQLMRGYVNERTDK